MNINLNKVVVHELIKEQHIKATRVELAEKTLDPKHEITKSLIEKLLKKFNTKGNRAMYGVFGEGARYGGFPKDVGAYNSTKVPTDDDFLSLTVTAMERLEEYASNVSASTGGFILFADYGELKTGRYLLVAIVKQREAFGIEGLTPEQLEALDLEKLSQAARVNFARLSNFQVANDEDRQDMTYLNFISRTTDSASAYFTGALGCKAGATAHSATKTVFRETLGYFDENAALKPRKPEFREALCSYFAKCDTEKRAATLSELQNLVASHLPIDNEELHKSCDELFEKLNSEEHEVPNRFNVSKRAFNQYKRIRVRTATWNLEFDRNLLGESKSAKFVFDSNDKSLLIRDLPERLLGEIEDEIKDQAC